ncbi:MAG: transketolase [Candidatus Tagabacteria bacterium RIFCSPLOWO2_01_FULL_39_11]|uniref:Transketolase n=1 Tax=Candidatus Tagabacteria bacterium RIFCSPLOWO2_01_FULL_39_11 TaxID=1802295 RepID=A0A1G2LRP2_9BACT|nr:MAG: transketolase [Candidatus Tagabacteria bacterium RIFCSPLOWO2_01_FULL_39_11]
MKLAENLFEKDKLEQAPTRNGYGAGLVKAGEENKNVVALCADLTDSTRTQAFKDKFPERFIEMGVAEQNMASVASGMAAMGKIPFIASYAMFSPGRNWEQIRTTVCYNNQNVKICGAHAGVSVGPDGATHQAIEDIAITRVIPNMTVLAPCDAIEAEKATVAAAKMKGPVYIRFAREKTPVFTTKETPFEIGKAECFFKLKNEAQADAVIIACGPLVYNALLAAHELENEGLSICVVNNHTIKPIDEEKIIHVAKKSGAIVAVEEHQINGGMGSAVAEVLARNYPVPIEFVGVQNRFGESGNPEELIEKFGMGVEDIISAVKSVLDRKSKR